MQDLKETYVLLEWQLEAIVNTLGHLISHRYPYVSNSNESLTIDIQRQTRACSLNKEEFAQKTLGTREPWKKKKGKSAIDVCIDI